MSAPTKHELGQLGHLDLLALAVEAGAAPSELQMFRFGSRSRDQLIDALTRPVALARLAERADVRLEHDGA
jgi:hypothetical protein